MLIEKDTIIALVSLVACAAIVAVIAWGVVTRSYAQNVGQVPTATPTQVSELAGGSEKDAEEKDEIPADCEDPGYADDPACRGYVTIAERTATAYARTATAAADAIHTAIARKTATARARKTATARANKTATAAARKTATATERQNRTATAISQRETATAVHHANRTATAARKTATAIHHANQAATAVALTATAQAGPGPGPDPATPTPTEVQGQARGQSQGPSLLRTSTCRMSSTPQCTLTMFRFGATLPIGLSSTPSWPALKYGKLARRASPALSSSLSCSRIKRASFKF